MITDASNLMEIMRSVFREYDIRGVVGQDLTFDLAGLIGKAFGTYLKRKSHSVMALGWDVRLSSPPLKEKILQGVLSTGTDVIEIGKCPTPMLYFALYHLPVQGGVMITGSHNPSDFNGFKLCAGRHSIFGEEIQQIRELIERQDFEQGQGKVQTADINADYIKSITNQFSESIGRVKRPIKVVLDAGNGAASLVAPVVFKALGCDVVELYCEADGRFPNHHPDPTVVENVKDLIAKVKETGADVGIGYDGDADRIGVVDDQGKIVWGDRLMMIFAREILKQNQSAQSPPVFVSEVKCSHLLYQDIRSRGGRAVMWKAGHSLIKAKMKEEGAVLGGEMSGHLFFADRHFGYDDAVYASCRLVEILAHSEHPLSGMLSDLPQTYSTPEIRKPCADDSKFQVVGKLQEILQVPAAYEAPYPVQDVNTVDGVRVTFSNGWGLVRASNTQPALVARFEADSEEAVRKIEGFMESLLRKILDEIVH